MPTSGAFSAFSIRALAATCALLLIATGCSGDGDQDGSPTRAGASARSDSSSAPETVTVGFRADPAIADRTAQWFGAGEELGAGADGVKIQPTSSALLSALDAENNVIGTAVTVTLPGTKQSEVVVGPRSTALSMVLMQPQFVSTNPVQNALYAGLALEAPSFDQLQAAVAADPTPFDDEAGLIGRAVAQVGSEVEQNLSDLATSLGLTQPVEDEPTIVPSRTRATDAGEIRIIGASAVNARTGAGTVDANGWGGEECLRLDNGRGLFQAPGSQSFCATAERSGDGWAVTIENRSYLWAAVLTGGDTSRPETAVAPLRFVLPQTADILEALIRTSVKAVVAKVGPYICDSLSQLGGLCPDEFADFSFLESLWDQLNPVRVGEATFWVDDEQAEAGIVLHTPALRAENAPSPNDWTGPAAATRPIWAFDFGLSLWSQALDPLLALVLNVRSLTRDDGSDPAVATAREAAFEALTEKFLPADAEGSDQGVDTLIRTFDIADLTAGANGLEAIMPIVHLLGETAFELVTDLDVLMAVGRYLLGGVAEKLSGTAVGEFVTKQLAGLATGTKWLDAAAEGANAVAGVALMTTGLVTHLQRNVLIPLATNDPQAELGAMDWSSAELTFVGQVDTAERYATANRPVSFTRDALPEGYSAVTMQGAVSGMWKPRTARDKRRHGTKPLPVVAVGFATEPTSSGCNFVRELNDSCQLTASIFHLNLFTMKNGRPEPVAYQSWVDTPNPARDFVDGPTQCLDKGNGNSVTTLEKGQLVEYRTFSDWGPTCTFRIVHRPQRAVLKRSPFDVVSLDSARGAGIRPYRGVPQFGVHWDF